MAYASDTRTASRGATIAERFAAFRATLAERRAQRRVFQSTRAELSALSDRELSELAVRTRTKGGDVAGSRSSNYLP